MALKMRALPDIRGLKYPDEFVARHGDTDECLPMGGATVVEQLHDGAGDLEIPPLRVLDVVGDGVVLQEFDEWLQHRRTEQVRLIGEMAPNRRTGHTGLGCDVVSGGRREPFCRENTLGCLDQQPPYLGGRSSSARGHGRQS